MADTDQVDNTPDVEDVSLIDNAIAPKTDAPSEPAAEGQDASADTQDKPETDDSEAKPSEGEQAPAEEQPQPQPETDTQAEQRRLNAEAAARRVQERQRTKQVVEQQIDQSYGPKTEEQFIEEGLTPEQAEVRALREEMQFERQKTHIAEMNAGLQAEAVNVYNDFPIFNPDSKDYDPEFAQMVEQQYATAARLQTDEQGFVLNADVPLYDFHKQMNDIYNRGASKGNKQAQNDAAQMLARTENVGGSSSTSGNSGNELADLEERLGNAVIT